MPQRLKLLSQAGCDAVVEELNVIADKVSDIGSIIGPAYGAPWCDKALKIRRLLIALEMQLKDRFYAQTQSGKKPL